MANWVLVADSATARLFEQRTALSWRRVDQREHPASREQGADLIGNRPHQNQHNGEKTAKGAGPNAMRDEESRVFARELAAVVKRQLPPKDRLTLVAPPKFLGLLRQELEEEHLGPQLADALPKDYTSKRDDELLGLVELPPAL